jgi:hypothetical protein
LLNAGDVTLKRIAPRQVSLEDVFVYRIGNLERAETRGAAA